MRSTATFTLCKNTFSVQIQVDCKWDNWSSWSCIDEGFHGCTAGKIGRSRTIAVEPKNLGDACVGSPIKLSEEWCNVNVVWCQCLANIPIPPGILGKTLRREVAKIRNNYC